MKSWMLLLLGAFCAAAQPGWEVNGTIRNQSGPVKNLWVSMTGPEGLRPQMTDSRGSYSFKGSVAGTYSIRVSKSDDAGEPRSRTLTLTPGQKLDRIDFLLARGAVIEGKITDREGRPVPGVVVEAFLRTQDARTLRLSQTGAALSDDRGEYKIQHLSDGVYVVAAVPTTRHKLPITKKEEKPVGSLAPAYPPVTFCPGGTSQSSASLIEIRQGASRSGVDITMEKLPVYCAFFRADSASLAPAGSVQFAAVLDAWLDALGPRIAQARVRPGEDYQVCGLPAGEYRLGIYGFARSPANGVGYGRLDVVVGQRHVEVGSVNVAGFQDLRGTVVVKDARPEDPIPEGIRVALSRRHRSLLPRDTLGGRVGKDGAFHLQGVYQDSYGFSIVNLPDGCYILKADQDGQDLKTAEVRTGAGAIQVLLAADGPVVSGRVLQGDREPVPVADATVFLISSRTDQVRTAQSDQSGAYRFSSGVEPGEYKLVAVTDLPDSQRHDGRLASLFLSRATDTITLRTRDNKMIDLKAVASQ